MVSLLDSSTRKKHKTTWIVAKTISFLFIILFVVSISHLSQKKQESLSSSSRYKEKRRQGEVFSAISQSSPQLGTSFTSTFEPPSRIFGHGILSSNGTQDDDEEEECPISLVRPEEQCNFAKTHEGCQGNKFTILLFCVLQPVWAQPFFYIFITIIVFHMFYLLGNTAEEYFSPSLIKLSTYLRLSPNVAGVTLLALGNGAPELSAIIVGLSKGNEGVGMGAPLGSGVFVTTLVLGIVTLVADVKVTRRPFLRDATFYLISVSYVLYMYLMQRVMIWEGIICILIYIIYVLVVIFSRLVNQKLIKPWLKKRSEQKKKQKALLKKVPVELGEQLLNKDDMAEAEAIESSTLNNGDSLENGQKDEEGKRNSDSGSDNDNRLVLEPVEIKNIEEEDDDDDDDDDDGDITDWTGGWRKMPKLIFDNMQGSSEKEKKLKKQYSSMIFIPSVGIISKPKDLEETKSTLVVREHFNILSSDRSSVQEEDDGDDDNDENPERKPSKLYQCWNGILNHFEWREKGIFGKFYFLFVEIIWIILRDITIPRVEEKWNKYTNAVVPILAPLMILLSFTQFEYFIRPIPAVIPCSLAAIGFVMSMIVLITSPTRKPPFYQPIFVVMAFIMSIVWIYVSVEQVVEIIQTVGAAWNIKPSILAITVLAWGNSIGDLVADVVVARQGYPSMAVSACFGGPLVALMLGLGLAFTFSPSRATPTCVQLNPDPNVIISILFLMGSILSALIIIPICGFRSRKLFGIILCLSYFVYMGTGLTATFFKPFGNLFIWNTGYKC